MKAVILAGGLGTRLSEETGIRPKPMVEIGGKPMLWHIMKIYSYYGITEFIIACGYKSYIIKDYFANYILRSSDVTFDFATQSIQVHKHNGEAWKVTLVETGESAMTGGRIKSVKDYIGDETFCLTYGDGVSDINIQGLIDFHKGQNVYATLSAVQPPGRFGSFVLGSDQTKIVQFREKPKGDGAWVNGGFFVLEPAIFDYITDDQTVWEEEPLKKLAQDGKLAAYKHDGFWQNMDTLRDVMVLENLWQSTAPWKVWK